MADHQQAVLAQMATAQAQTNKQLWEQVIQSMATTRSGTSGNGNDRGVSPAIRVQKMTLNVDDDPEAYLNAFECTTEVGSRAAGLKPCGWLR